MAELIEAHIVTKVNIPIEYLFQFIHENMNSLYLSKRIIAIDNWEYENEVTIDDIKSIYDVVNKKIVLIFETFENGECGIDIECIKESFVYCIWFNCEDNDIQYEIRKRNFINFCNKQKVIRLGAIGRETVFEYDVDIDNTVSKSHDIDEWIIP